MHRTWLSPLRLADIRKRGDRIECLGGLRDCIRLVRRYMGTEAFGPEGVVAAWIDRPPLSRVAACLSGPGNPPGAAAMGGPRSPAAGDEQGPGNTSGIGGRECRSGAGACCRGQCRPRSVTLAGAERGRIRGGDGLRQPNQPAIPPLVQALRAVILASYATVIAAVTRVCFVRRRQRQHRCARAQRRSHLAGVGGDGAQPSRQSALCVSQLRQYLEVRLGLDPHGRAC